MTQYVFNILHSSPYHVTLDDSSAPLQRLGLGEHYRRQIGPRSRWGHFAAMYEALRTRLSHPSWGERENDPSHTVLLQEAGDALIEPALQNQHPQNIPPACIVGCELALRKGKFPDITARSVSRHPATVASRVQEGILGGRGACWKRKNPSYTPDTPSEGEGEGVAFGKQKNTDRKNCSHSPVTYMRGHINTRITPAMSGGGWAGGVLGGGGGRTRVVLRATIN